MKQAEKTHVEISSDIFNDKMLTIKGCYKTTLRLTYPEKQYEGTTMEVIVEKQGQETRTKTLTPGDTFTYVHEFKAEIVYMNTHAGYWDTDGDHQADRAG